jgi:uncharacterized protein (TIGR00369 family)
MLRGMDIEQLQAALPEYFAPWVLALDLKVVSSTGSSVTLRLPNTSALSRSGGMVCGQALMAAADTAMVLALMQHFGQFRPCTTVQMNTSFLKPLAQHDGMITANVLRAGKSLAFGEIDISNAQDGKSVCRASTTYALL